MRTFVLSIILIAGLFGFAQSGESGAERKFTGSLLLRVYDGPTIGFNFEKTTEAVSYISYLGTINVNVPETSKYGNGFVLGLGLKYYLKEKSYGWNVQNAVEYAQYNFSESDYTGTYRCVSLVTPQLGYKFKLGNFAIEPAVGFIWKIEMEGKGDVDNNSLPNTKGKFGLNVGYMF